MVNIRKVTDTMSVRLFTVLSVILCCLVGVAWAGATAGERYWEGRRLGANSYCKYYISFEGNEEARVAASACCKTDDIDIQVFDANGWLVVSDVLPDYYPFCKWVPNKTAVYTIKVINCKNRPLTFSFAHN